MIIKRVRDILQTKTFIHSGITFFGTLINGVLGIIFFIILARNLGPADFGVVSATIALFALSADILDFGTNTGIINFVGKYAKTEFNIALAYLKTAFNFKLIVGLLAGFIGFLCSNQIATLLGKPELTVPIQIAAFGILGSLLFTFSTNALQAFQKFIEWSLLNIFTNALRLLILGLLVIYSYLTVSNSMILYIIVLYAGFLVGVLTLKVNFLKKSSVTKLPESFFHYNKWIGSSALITAFSSRLDTLFLTRYASFADVGTYSVAVQLTSIIPQFIYALAVVVAPKLASINNNNEAIKYLKKLQLYVLGLAVLGLIALPLAYYLIPFFYGEEFKAAVWVFSILFLGQIIFLLSLPVHQAIFYYFSKPKVMTTISFFQLIILSICLYIGSRYYGITGVAWSVVIASLINFILPALWVINQFGKRNEK